MILRVVLIFLIVIAVLGMIGKLRWPMPRHERDERVTKAGHRCPDCNSFVVEPAPEPCGRPDCRFRT